MAIKLMLRPIQFRSFSSSSSLSKIKLLEVEQKFTYLPRLLPAFEANRGRPRFKSLAFIEASKFRDTYFDDETGTLFRKRIYVRKRDDAWELKQKVTAGSSNKGGEFDGVTYDEISDTKAIADVLKQHIPTTSGSDPNGNFGLKPYCDYITSRRVFKADDRFSIMLDATNFRHSAGEIELMVPQEEADNARGEIEKFMEEYKWFFKPMGNITHDNGKPIEPKGKMTAYFEKYGMPF